MAFGQYSENSRDRSRQISSTGIVGRSKVKRVFTPSMVAHVWAQQTQEDGRSSNGNFYFHGKTIYSYRNSWPLATFIEPYEGKPVIIVNHERYSVTTSSQLSDVQGALRGLDVHVINIGSTELINRIMNASEKARRDIINEKIAGLKALAKSYCNPKKSIYFGYVENADYERIPDNATQRAADIANDAAQIHFDAKLLGVDIADCEEFNARELGQQIRDAFEAFNNPEAIAKREKARLARSKKTCLELIRKTPAYLPGQYRQHKAVERLDAAIRDAVTLNDEKTFRAAWRIFQRTWLKCDMAQTFKALHPEAQRIRERALWDKPSKRISAAQWLAGEEGDFSQSSPTLVRRKGDRLETSRGADAPWRHAVAIFLKAQNCMMTKSSWHRNGSRMQAGHFELESIDTDGNIKIGCHHIRFEDMAALALREIPQHVAYSFPLPAVIVESV